MLEAELLRADIEALTADRDSWKQAHDEQVEKLLEISANRDEYQVEADNMAASHKVERDALTAERDHWKAQHKECTRLLGEALQEVTDIAVERDANAKNAARYRFITANIVDDGDMNVLEEAFGDLAYSDTCTESEFDACIDRAIAKAAGEKT